MASLKQPRELPLLKDYLTFLESKFTAMESSRRKQEATGSKTSFNTPSTSNNQAKPSRFKQYFTSYKQANSSGRTFTQPPKYQSPPQKSTNQQNKFKCGYCNSTEHGIYCCTQFLRMSPYNKGKFISNSNLCQNCLYDHNGKACFSEKKCRECHGNHNSILHETFATSSNMSSGYNKAASRPADHVGRHEQHQQKQTSAHVSQENVTETLLATAEIKIRAADGTYHSMRALIDQGSQTSLITERAAQQLGLPRKRRKDVIFGVGAKESNCKGITNLSCASLYTDFEFNTDVYIINHVVNHLPQHTFPKPSWTCLENVELADARFYIRRPIDILLGAVIYSSIILSGIIKMNANQPVLQQTQLGWIISGNVKIVQCNVVLSNTNDLQRFWEIEDITDESIISTEDQDCIEHYQATTKRNQDGRYIVKLPFKPDYQEKLGQSKSIAIAQFLQVERKFTKNPGIALEYKRFMQEYQDLGHMSPASKMTPVVFLPHHCIQRPESTTTALRVVFNASAKTSSGVSLNDVMNRGPNLQQDLQSLILKWRLFPYAFTADIEKMFRQILIAEDHQKYQGIIWRDFQNKQLGEFNLSSVTYGTRSAPFLAMMTLKQLAKDEGHNYQESKAAKAVESSFYMDDLLYGSYSKQAVIKIQQDLIKLLKSGGFNLRKWTSNTPEFLQEASTNQFEFKQVDSTKTLGLRWNPQQDNFTFQSNIGNVNREKHTKRSLLSDISRFFDPMGWVTPLTTKLKILFQKVWLNDILWDDELPKDIKREWMSIKDDIQNINQYQVSRWLGTKEKDVIELHGFCDASTKCYACVIYCKISRKNETSVTLVVGKARLVPTTKQLTTPKLEISGAHLLARLMDKTKKCFEDHEIKIYGWIDSTAVLGWLQGDPSRWKTFVANRVQQITKIMPPNCWRYVKSAENPADCASRGLSATQLQSYSLWWEGPTWLKNFQNEVNQDLPKYETNQEIRKSKQVNVTEPGSDQQILQKYSSYTKTVHVLAWVMRFITIKNKKTQLPYLSFNEIKQANIELIKYTQQQEYYQEIKDLKQKNQIKQKSTISNLNPFFDEHGILRVGGRLRNANIDQEMKHPIILPKSSNLTKLIINHAHKMTHHGGARLTLSFIRKRYWIVSGNNTVKKQIRSCITCRKHSPAKQEQLMGDLPEARCNPSRIFEHTGVDLTGFIMVKASKGRGQKSTKGYVAVFICMATKNVHLEIVSDLTTATFIAALRRMAARRGTPRHIYSDNGTNFVGANKVLQQEYEELYQKFNQNNQEFIKEITEMEISWHFNTPSWPSAGGLWEAAVKSLKFHLKRVIGEQKLTYEELSTVLAQLEATLNSRPLCPITENPDDLDYLTPSHFATGGPTLTLIENDHDMRTRWHLTQKIFNDIWKRWQAEYLKQLSARSKWRESKQNIKLDDVVLIADAYLPAGKWAMGRVVELHPGKDDLVRVVTLKTKNGYIKRPITKLSVLPLNDNKTEQMSDKNNHQTAAATTSSRVKGKKSNFISLALSLILFMTTITSSACSINVTPIRDQQRLYLDKITNMQLIREDWKIVVYYDLEPYWQGVRAFSKYKDNLNQSCIKISKQTHCEAVSLQLQHGYDDLEYYNELILNQHSGGRKRRGLINGVGYVANALFGVLDSSFQKNTKRT